MEDATTIVMGFANLVDTLFIRYTGKTMGEILRESAQRPRELPVGERTAIAEAEPEMSLDMAYAVLGLKPDASPDDVKRNYRNLARAFHSDKGLAMNEEAMKLLNRAHDRILRDKRDAAT